MDVYNKWCRNLIKQDEIHRMAQSEDVRERREVVHFLRSNIAVIKDKDQAWADLHKLTYDKDCFVQLRATIVLCSTFHHIYDKELAWSDLIRLSQSKDRYVKMNAALALGSAYPNITDKVQAWMDMIKLSELNDSDLKTYVEYSLGKSSIFKATETESEEEFKKELEIALEFFEKSLEKSTYSNPANFCLPFYRSFYTITFKREGEKSEVNNYFEQAKNAVEGSEDKEKLLEAVKNLSNALEEVQKTQEMDFKVKKGSLNAYRQYCERAADLLNTTNEKAPGATKLIRRGLPMIDHQIKNILAEIQKNAENLCKQTIDTPFEDLGKEVNQVGQELSLIRDPIGLEKNLNNMITELFNICHKFPLEDQGDACRCLKKAEIEPYIEDKLPLINMVLSKISTQFIFGKKLDQLMISLKPSIREEFILNSGIEVFGTGGKHVITIPLQEISYDDLIKDLKIISEDKIVNLTTLPPNLVNKIQNYIQKKKDSIFKNI